MPPYTTSGQGTLALNTTPPSILYPGDDKYVIGRSYAVGVPPTPGQVRGANDSNVVFEAVTIGMRSIAVCLASRLAGGPPGCIVQISASADPGATEIDVQDAGVDADGAYLTPTTSANYKVTSWTHNGGVWTAWTEFQPEGGRFITLKVIANPNGVSFTAKISYV